MLLLKTFKLIKVRVNFSKDLSNQIKLPRVFFCPIMNVMPFSTKSQHYGLNEKYNFYVRGKKNWSELLELITFI